MKTFDSTIRLLAVLSSASVWILATGCEPTAATVNKTASSTSSDHGHDHGHDHSHDHGPNGGHLVDLAPIQMHAEWSHNDESGKITIHFTDLLNAGKKVDSAKIDLSVIGQEPKTYDFKATENGTYEIESVELLTAIELCTGEKDSKVSAKLIASVDGAEQTAPIVHHDHGHDH